MQLLTDRLRLTPIGPVHADELWQLHQCPGIAEWNGGTVSRGAAREHAAHVGARWRVDGVHNG